MGLAYAFAALYIVGIPGSSADYVAYTHWWQPLLIALALVGLGRLLTLSAPKAAGFVAKWFAVGSVIGAVGAPFWHHANQVPAMLVSLVGSLWILRIARTTLHHRSVFAGAVLNAALLGEAARQPLTSMGAPVPADVPLLTARAAMLPRSDSASLLSGYVSIMEGGVLRFASEGDGGTVMISRQEVQSMEHDNEGQVALLRMTLDEVLPWNVLRVVLANGAEGQWRAWHTGETVSPTA
jgi:hypothetical protein